MTGDNNRPQQSFISKDEATLKAEELLNQSNASLAATLKHMPPAVTKVAFFSAIKFKVNQRAISAFNKMIAERANTTRALAEVKEAEIDLGKAIKRLENADIIYDEEIRKMRTSRDKAAIEELESKIKRKMLEDQYNSISTDIKIQQIERDDKLSQALHQEEINKQYRVEELADAMKKANALKGNYDKSSLTKQQKEKLDLLNSVLPPKESIDIQMLQDELDSRSDLTDEERAEGQKIIDELKKS